MESEYVLGLAFSKNKNNLLVIKKNRPEWQKGKFNGIGGRIKPGENPRQAMIREFQEETGLITQELDWQHFCIMKRSRNFVCYVYRMFSDNISNYQSTTDEIVHIVTNPIRENFLKECVSNLGWLILAAKDSDNFSIKVTYSPSKQVGTMNLKEKEEKMSFENEGTDNLVCPYCGHEQTDSWEYDSGDDLKATCKECEKEFIYETEVTRTFTSRKSDCLNGGKTHNWSIWNWYPAGEFRWCRDCNEREYKDMLWLTF